MNPKSTKRIRSNGADSDHNLNNEQIPAGSTAATGKMPPVIAHSAPSPASLDYQRPPTFDGKKNKPTTPNNQTATRKFFSSFNKTSVTCLIVALIVGLLIGIVSSDPKQSSEYKSLKSDYESVLAAKKNGDRQIRQLTEKNKKLADQVKKMKPDYEAAEKSRKEEAAKKKAEEKAKQEQEEKEKQEAAEKAKAQQEAQAQAQAQQQAQAQAQAEAQARAQAQQQRRAPAPSQGTVRGGAFCSPLGAKGTSSAGNTLTCRTASDGRARWMY